MLDLGRFGRADDQQPGHQQGDAERQLVERTAIHRAATPFGIVLALVTALSGAVFARSLGGRGAVATCALLYWVGMARLIRGQILSLKEQEFVLASKSIGTKNSWVIRKHLLPNCMSVIIISTALQVPSAIFTESFLSFLGLGVAAPMPSLGSLASDALSGIYSYSYRLFYPALVIFMIVLSFNLFGNGLRDAFDPKLKN